MSVGLLSARPVVVTPGAAANEYRMAIAIRSLSSNEICSARSEEFTLATRVAPISGMTCCQAAVDGLRQVLRSSARAGTPTLR